MKNSQLKRAFATDEYTPEMIQELSKCKNDPIYFIKNYVKIQLGAGGTSLFKLFEYQERFIKCMHTNRFVCALTARQQGKTTCVAMYLLWKACFTNDVTLLIASKNQSHALEIASKVRFAYEALPNWLKPGLKYYNRHNIELENGSRIVSEATTEKTGRGLSISCVAGNTLITIRNKFTLEAEDLTIGDFTDRVLSNHSASNFEVMSGDGTFQSFKGVRVCRKPTVELSFDSGENLECTLDHKLKLSSGEFREVKNINVGECLFPNVKLLKKKDPQV